MCAGLMSFMGERRGVYRVLQGNLRDRKNLDDLGIGSAIVLK